MIFRSALFSENQKHRYGLISTIGEMDNMQFDRYVNWLMLNPSTANEFQDDPTLRRCMAWTKKMGYDTMAVTNLFSYRATDPLEMKKARNPEGDPENLKHIVQLAERSNAVICAWGSHGTHRDRAEKVVAELRKRQIPLHILKLNGSGQPGHPLYLPQRLTPVPWEE